MVDVIKKELFIFRELQLRNDAEYKHDRDENINVHDIKWWANGSVRERLNKKDIFHELCFWNYIKSLI